jgi:hypothetical protein
MSNSQYLQNLVESMPRRLEDVINRDRTVLASSRALNPIGPLFRAKIESIKRKLN